MFGSSKQTESSGYAKERGQSTSMNGTNYSPPHSPTVDNTDSSNYHEDISVIEKAPQRLSTALSTMKPRGRDPSVLVVAAGSYSSDEEEQLDEEEDAAGTVAPSAVNTEDQTADTPCVTIPEEDEPQFVYKFSNDSSSFRSSTRSTGGDSRETSGISTASGSGGKLYTPPASFMSASHNHTNTENDVFVGKVYSPTSSPTKTHENSVGLMDQDSVGYPQGITKTKKSVEVQNTDDLDQPSALREPTNSLSHHDKRTSGGQDKPPLISAYSAPVRTSASPSHPTQPETPIVAYTVRAVPAAATAHSHHSEQNARRSIADALYSRPSTSRSVPNVLPGDVSGHQHPQLRAQLEKPQATDSHPQLRSTVPARRDGAYASEPNILQAALPARATATVNHHHSRSESDLRSSLPAHLARLSMQKHDQKRDQLSDALFRRSPACDSKNTSEAVQKPAPEVRSKPGIVHTQVSGSSNRNLSSTQSPPFGRNSSSASVGSSSSGGSSTRGKVQTVQTTQHLADGTIREIIEKRLLAPDGKSYKVISTSTTTRIPAPVKNPVVQTTTVYVAPPKVVSPPAVRTVLPPQQFLPQQPLPLPTNNTATNNSNNRADQRMEAEARERRERWGRAAMDIGLGAAEALADHLNSDQDGNGGGFGLLGALFGGGNDEETA